MTSHIDIGNALLGLGCIQAAAGVFLVAFQIIRRRGCMRLEGTVVDHEVDREDSDGIYYQPIVEYAAPSGERVRLKYGLAFPKPLAVDGSERRVVWHDAVNPKRSHVDAKVKSRLPKPVMYALPFISLTIGAILRFGLGHR